MVKERFINKLRYMLMSVASYLHTAARKHEQVYRRNTEATQRKQHIMCFIQTENQRSPVVKKKKFTGAFRYWVISYLHTHTTVLSAARKHELIPYEETRAVFIQPDNQRSRVVKISLSAFSGRLQAKAHGVVPPYRQRQS